MGVLGSLSLQGTQAPTVVRSSARDFPVRYANQPLFARYAPAFAAAAHIASLGHASGALFGGHLAPAGSSAYVKHTNVSPRKQLQGALDVAGLVELGRVLGTKAFEPRRKNEV
jgi:hypothetical protein